MYQTEFMLCSPTSKVRDLFADQQKKSNKVATI